MNLGAPGRRALDDRQALNGILYVWHTGIAWRDLPQELGSGVTRWRRLRTWQQAGVWEKLRHKLLNRLNAAGQIDWSRAAIDGSHSGGSGTGETELAEAQNDETPAVAGVSGVELAGLEPATSCMPCRRSPS